MNDPAISEANGVSTVRYHHLDALRAFAMLLGLVLHSLMSFIEIPVWPAQDLYQNSKVYGFLLHAIHGFRMPLFFLISGFFTALLWRKRGMLALIKNRAIRILVPMVIGLVVAWPILIAIGIWGGISKARLAGQRLNLADENAATIWVASKNGDVDAIELALKEGGNVHERDKTGITPLGWATLADHVEAMELLINRGADVNAGNQDGSTPLHAAAFLGRIQAAELLLESGADVDPRNNKQETPLDSAKAEWGVVEWVAGFLQIKVIRDEVMAGRKKTVALLKSRMADPSDERNESENPLKAVIGIWTFGSMMPVFHHLWFLYYLCWLVAAFAIVAPIASKLPWRFSERLVSPSIRWFWLLPLTLFAQLFMVQTFGPDTATGLLPWPPKLFYYAVFFAFGVLCFGKETFENNAGKRWPIWFLLSIPMLFTGLYCFERRGGQWELYHPLTCLFSVLYAWLMIFGWIGFFRRFCSSENPRIRYISDSAYWLYLAHLPLVMALQILVSGWHFPAFVKFLGIIIVATTILLATYEYWVRYTFVGAVLNGRKHRIKAPSRIAPGIAKDDHPQED